MGFRCHGCPAREMRYLRISERVPWPYHRKYGGLRYEEVALNAGLTWTPVRITRNGAD